MAQKLDTVILATGDGDFVPLVEYLRYTHGIQVEVISFGKSSSGQLKEVVDDFIDMCENPRNYLIGYKGEGKSRGWIPGFSSSSNGNGNGNGHSNSTSHDEGVDVGKEVYEDEN